MDASLYQRPNKPFRAPIVERKKVLVAPSPLPEPIAIHYTTECHVTPPDVALRMASYIPPLHKTVLEPHCGTGNLVAALLENGFSLKDITAVELSGDLIQVVNNRFPGLPLMPGCFLNYARKCCKRYSSILMNPPFKHVKLHMNAALGLLEKGGGLIALVPVSYSHPDETLLEKLPQDTFHTAKVNTKIIKIIKG
tara:strand:- start:1682 stop:2266 length:585 start_codon:yes stop_codon:yes gene_type:complete